MNGENWIDIQPFPAFEWSNAKEIIKSIKKTRAILLFDIGN